MFRTTESDPTEPIEAIAGRLNVNVCPTTRVSQMDYKHHRHKYYMPMAIINPRVWLNHGSYLDHAFTTTLYAFHLTDYTKK